MGLAYTIDSPIKIAHFGIDSVISLGDDQLIEKMRQFYSMHFEMLYSEISDKIEDFRAKRITSYLNLINEIVTEKFEHFKDVTFDKIDEIKEYFNKLPDSSTLKNEFHEMISCQLNFGEISTWLKENLKCGSVDVNIMTKLDREYFKQNEKLPIEYNDAHAALRGVANSDANCSVILSAGMNPRLYSYISNFNDFFPDENGEINKKIILKVSDYRSALIQGKFLAKKGIWVSEYRVESGLNCGGHAFPSDGFLIGPILDEFKNNREQLKKEISDIIFRAFDEKNIKIKVSELPLKITYQGGVGTAEEHDFILEKYDLDSIGWGSPFLLVPEATTVDSYTLNQLIAAKENDIYLSKRSPLGVPFNSLRRDTAEVENKERVASGRPGSPCPKLHLNFNTEFTERPICTASRQYQRLKLQELKNENPSETDHKIRFDEIVTKSCLCVGLGNSALVHYDIERKVEGDAVMICPGPNLAYFDKEISLNDMIDHIYGRKNVIQTPDRPNVFIKEIGLYIDYLKGLIDETSRDFSLKQKEYLQSFAENMQNGIKYYNKLFDDFKTSFSESRDSIISELKTYKKVIESISVQINEL